MQLRLEKELTEKAGRGDFNYRVSSLKEMMEVVYPGGPYMVYHHGVSEEKTICVAKGYEFFIHVPKSQSKMRRELFPNMFDGFLMAYPPEGGWYVIGYVGLDEGDELPNQTAVWDEDHDRWSIRTGTPARRTDD